MEEKNNINDVYQKILKKIEDKYTIKIFAGGNRLSLNPFVQDLYYKTIKTMVSALHKGEQRDIEIMIKN
jgi:hypothetical protein